MIKIVLPCRLDHDRIGRAQLEVGGNPARLRDFTQARWALRRLMAAPSVPPDVPHVGRHQTAGEGAGLAKRANTRVPTMRWGRSGKGRPRTRRTFTRSSRDAWPLLKLSAEGEGTNGAVMASPLWRGRIGHRASCFWSQRAGSRGVVRRATLSGGGWDRGSGRHGRLGLCGQVVAAGGGSGDDLGERNPGKPSPGLPRAAMPRPPTERGSVSRDAGERILKVLESCGIVEEVTLGGGSTYGGFVSKSPS